MTTLTIVRGLPGAGKSTFAKSLGVLHLESDMFFMQDGKYNFKSERLHRCHKQCFFKCVEIIAHDVDVVVSNTFTTWKELKEYVELAYQFGVNLHIIALTSTNYGSIHDVSQDTLTKMSNRWQSNEVIKERIDGRYDVDFSGRVYYTTI